MLMAPLVFIAINATLRCEQCGQRWAYKKISKSDARSIDVSVGDQTWEKCKFCGHLRLSDDAYNDHTDEETT